MKHKSKAISKSLFYVLTGIFIVFALFLKRFVTIGSQIFTVGLESILFTLKTPMKGADTGFLINMIDGCRPKSLIVIFCSYLAIFFLFECVFSKVSARIEIKISKRKISLDIYKIAKIAPIVICIFLFATAVISAEKVLNIKGYLKHRAEQTHIYEERYIKPVAEKIKGNGKNLIYIYLESLETTYASIEDGGKQTSVNYIPHLTELANENINFSSTEKLGGFHACSGATWTMGALFSTSTGVPFQFPIQGNSMNYKTNFATGITAIGDILKEKGYTNEFLCGSNGDFAGRKQFFEQHGDYKVFDLFTARQKGYIPSEYYVWWGFEDEILFKIAKDELKGLAESSQPFNLTLLTVDTHHVGGYKCKLCGNKYSENLANVVECQDNQVYDFVNWCKTQDFFKDTVIVLTGDHPRMDSILVDGISYYDRTVYNCFINAQKKTAHVKNRVFTTLDMFPTVLSAMGFEIEGDKFGLGTDLFSPSKTLSEELGFSVLNAELSKFSKYYIDNFS